MTARRERRSERAERYEAVQRDRNRRPKDRDRRAFEDAMAALLHRVSNRPRPEPDDPPPPPPREDIWWSPTPVLGYRLWELRNGWLHGAWTKWDSTRKTARCLDTHSRASGPVPHNASECRHPPCGIYAMKWPSKVRAGAEHLIRHSPVPATVAIGLVALSGRVIEHEHGLRAEHARVLALAMLTGAVGKPAIVSCLPSDSVEAAFSNPGATRAHDAETLPIYEAVNRAVRHLREQSLAHTA